MHPWISQHSQRIKASQQKRTESRTGFRPTASYLFPDKGDHLNVSTAGLLTAILGFLGLLVHAGLAFMSLLGTGLASTPDDPVPKAAETWWGISLWGTPVAGIALLVLMIRWTKPLAAFYAATWISLVGCFWAGWIVNGAPPAGPMLVIDIIPIASAAFGIYGVWKYCSEDPPISG